MTDGVACGLFSTAAADGSVFRVVKHVRNGVIVPRMYDADVVVPPRAEQSGNARSDAATRTRRVLRGEPLEVVRERCAVFTIARSDFARLSRDFYGSCHANDDA